MSLELKTQVRVSQKVVQLAGPVEREAASGSCVERRAASLPLRILPAGIEQRSCKSLSPQPMPASPITTGVPPVPALVMGPITDGK